MSAILIFFFCHWFLSLFFHTFFLHRYASHQMYTTGKKTEKLFYFLTWLTGFLLLNSPFLCGTASYASCLQRYGEDPHSPHFFKDIWRMMWHTRTIYNDIVNKKNYPTRNSPKNTCPPGKNWIR